MRQSICGRRSVLLIAANEMIPDRLRILRAQRQEPVRAHPGAIAVERDLIHGSRPNLQSGEAEQHLKRTPPALDVLDLAEVDGAGIADNYPRIDGNVARGQQERETQIVQSGV